jgi:hypothetical protein
VQLGAAAAGAAAGAASLFAAILAEISPCGVCSGQELLRRHGRGQSLCEAWLATLSQTFIEEAQRRPCRIDNQSGVELRYSVSHDGW